MTLAELQAIPCYQGWSIVPRSGPRLPLTPRERQILGSVLDGHTHKEVAFDLGVAAATVRVLYSRAMRKLGRVRVTSRGLTTHDVQDAEGAEDEQDMQEVTLSRAVA